MVPEKCPAQPLSFPRPGKEHKVADNETLESVARHYGVSYMNLVQHNFGTTDAAEINWYLREKLGCKLQTHDGKWWRFSKAAEPGLIYIPAQVVDIEPVQFVDMDPAQFVEMEPVVISGQKPDTPLWASQKRGWEWKLPKEPKEVWQGRLLAQIKFNLEFEVKQDRGLLKGSYKEDQFKVALEKKLSDSWKVVFADKLYDKKNFAPFFEGFKGDSKLKDQAKWVGNALRTKDKWKHLGTALAKGFEPALKTTHAFGKSGVSLSQELGAEYSKIKPFVGWFIRTALEYENYPIEDLQIALKLVGKIGAHFTFTAKGWAWVAKEVGPRLLQLLLRGARAAATVGEQALAAVADWLTAEGMLAGAPVLGSIAGTLALTSLVAWMVQNVNRQAELRGLATWYISAYIARVFHGHRPMSFFEGDIAVRDLLVTLGEKDAAHDAQMNFAADRPDERGTDEQALGHYRALLVADQGSERNAKWHLQMALEKRANALAGL
jgi:hypothetical protein